MVLGVRQFPQRLSVDDEMTLPKPYYEEDGIVIYHGDCRDILPHLPKVDLVLTDPPYGMSFVSNYRTVKHAAIANDDQLPLDLIWLAMNKAERAAYFFCRWDNLRQMPQPKSVLAWVKNNWSMGDLEHEHGRQWEACCFYPKAGHSFIKRIPDVIYADRTGNGLHPTEKPQELLETIILANECQTILDPFMGSGTTLRAAKDLGRKAIGIEIEEKYCEIAVKRLAQEVLPL
jgi:site-specific DNA-methyltransferase (adenine-specific)